MTETYIVRESVDSDNENLVNLASSCPMKGAVELCFDRTPSFFALNRLEGTDFRVGVVDDDNGTAIGCICVSKRDSYINKVRGTSVYFSDLKVHPAWRGKGVADALCFWAEDIAEKWSDDSTVWSATVLAGNKSMEKRYDGPRGLARLENFATLRSFSIPLLHKRKLRYKEIDITQGHQGDIDEMAECWNSVAQLRQLAPYITAESFRDWIETAPGLDIAHYLLARDKQGTLLGFIGVWDQTSFKQLRVLKYSWPLSIVTRIFNSVSWIFRAPKLPGRGKIISNVTIVNVCVPGDHPEILRELLTQAYNTYRASKFSFLNIGLDITDPLCEALKGFGAQPTDVWGCVGVPQGKDMPEMDETFPFHHEIALV